MCLVTLSGPRSVARFEARSLVRLSDQILIHDHPGPDVVAAEMARLVSGSTAPGGGRPP